MKILTKKQRLWFYRKMLFDYIISTITPEKYRKFGCKTCFGFCHYISSYNKSNTEYKIQISDFPELMSQKPDKLLFLGYWFPSGHLKPRIKCIEKAIKLCKKNIQNKN